MAAIRLQKILSHAGIASRRLAEALIAQGRVEVNGLVVTTLGTKADPEQDEIRVDGRRVARRSPVRRHLLMYKPRGVVSTRADPQRRPTVIDLLVKAGIRGYFYPVGRLDFDSEGLIILTNDGDFAERVMHPRYQLERAYVARVLGTPDARDLERLERGVVIEGRRTAPATVRVLGSHADAAHAEATLEIVLREGRHRQVRLMCESIGHPVSRLKRVRIGTITDRGLQVGAIRDLLPAEVRSLLTGAEMPARTPRQGRATPERSRRRT
jgi:pseudouridine synthase